MAQIGKKYIDALIGAINAAAPYGTDNRYVHGTIADYDATLLLGSYGQYEGHLHNTAYPYTGAVRASDGKQFERYRAYPGTNFTVQETPSGDNVGVYKPLPTTKTHLVAGKWYKFTPTSEGKGESTTMDYDFDVYTIANFYNVDNLYDLEGDALFFYQRLNEIARHYSDGWTSNGCALAIKATDDAGATWKIRPNVVLNRAVIYYFLRALDIDFVIYTAATINGAHVGVTDLDDFKLKFFSAIGLKWTTDSSLYGSVPTTDPRWNDPPEYESYPITTEVVEGKGAIQAPAKGEKAHRIPFTVTPDTGYKIKTVYVKTTDGLRPVPLNGSAADSTTARKFSFPMPSEAVTIFAKFAKTDESSGDGGDGEQDDTTVKVPTAVPAIDVENQVVRNYLVNKANLARVAQALTKVDLEDDSGKRKFPISIYNYIIAIRALPINPLTHDAPHLTTVDKFVINGVDLGITDFSGYYPGIGYNYILHLGAIDVKGYYGNYMDYEPMTKYQLYLPYLGFVDLDGSLIVGKTLSVDYAYNYNDGDFIARIYTDSGDDRTCIATKNGSFTARLPVTSADANNAIEQKSSAEMRTLMAIASVGLAVGAGAITMASAGGAAPVAASATGKIASVMSASAQETVAAGKAALAVAGATAGAATAIYAAYRSYNDAAHSVQYSRSGDLSGFTAFYAPQKCYLYIDRPESAEPDNFAHYRGYRSEKTLKIGDLSGHTKIRDVILDGIDLTVAEKNELLTSLKNGVIL